MKPWLRLFLAVVAIGLPSCTWYESVRAKFKEGGTPNGPVRAVLKGQYDRRAAPGEHMQNMMPRDYYR